MASIEPGFPGFRGPLQELGPGRAAQCTRSAPKSKRCTLDQLTPRATCPKIGQKPNSSWGAGSWRSSSSLCTRWT